ncbi:MAG: class II fructose-1,6-bisphosphate aldolase [Firmicutes bacterium]|nr:class II fructose-1,6-bisphosphate aldolase [Bacillota bacterium]
MAFVAVSDLLRAADADGYAVGAFNLNNLEILQAIIAAAEAEQAPVIIQATQGGIKYGGLDYIAAMARVAAEEARVPVALNLDHGTSFEQAVRCIKAGFSAVMVDGSKLPFDENAALVKKVVDVAHAVGVSVEAELGKIGGTEDNITVSQREALMTDPEEAAEFVARSGADALAVSIGTAHGVYQGEPKLDFARLQEIARAVSIPLVLHGASGVPDGSIREAVRLGIRKINIDTEIRLAFAGSLRELLARDAGVYDPREILGTAREAMQKVVQEKIRLFGASGKARSAGGAGR